MTMINLLPVVLALASFFPLREKTILHIQIHLQVIDLAPSFAHRSRCYGIVSRRSRASTFDLEIGVKFSAVFCMKFSFE